MKASELLVDCFGRVREETRAVIQGLSVDQLSHRLHPGTNSIGWLVWHLTRVQDDHISDAADVEQVWTSKRWFERFQLPFDEHATGYGQSADEVAAVQVDADLLRGYLEDVHAQTISYVETLLDPDLDRIVDDSWDPPVCLGVRLVSVISDDLQHAAQAAFIRGTFE